MTSADPFSCKLKVEGGHSINRELNIICALSYPGAAEITILAMPISHDPIGSFRCRVAPVMA